MDEAEETIDVYADFRDPTIVDDMEGGIGLYILLPKKGESKSGLLPKLQRRIYYSAKKI